MAGPSHHSEDDAFRASYVRILETLCGAGDFQTAADTLVREVSRATACEAVSLRVHDHRDDYPFLAHAGLDESFIDAESSICGYDADGHLARDESGRPMLECMCGIVLSGGTDARKPYYTEAGSFCTNSFSELLAEISRDDICATMRTTCRSRGFESVALVPLRSGRRIVGLVQVNSREKGKFDDEALSFLEDVAQHAGAAIETVWRREELARLSKEFEEHRRGVETMVALGEMAATLAHEIKNPLAGMMLSATRLRKALEGQEKLESIAEHLVGSIDALSQTVTRVGHAVREPRLERSSADVHAVLESALAFVVPRASEQGVRIIREYDDEVPPILADAHYLMRAFLNLIVNALDVMPSGGALTLTTSRTGAGNVEVVIGDTGPGLGSVEIESLFRPFETKKAEGTGLGLGIVRRIVDLHSGAVTLRSGAGGGTEAVVTLNPGGERVREEAAAT